MRGLPVLIVALLAVAGAASAAPVPILTDPQGDAVVTAGPLANNPNYPQVDLGLVTGDLVGGVLDLGITTGAPITATERLTLRFSLDKGPTSFANSTARGIFWNLIIVNGAVTGASNATAKSEGSLLHLRVPLTSIRAVGGDVLGNLTLGASDSSGGTAPPPINQDDSSATDEAPNTGAASFTVPRIPVKAGLQLLPEGGTLREGSASTSIAGTLATTRSRNATVTFDLLVANTGTDTDTLTLSLPPRPAGVSDLRLNPQSLTLEAGRIVPATLTVQLNGLTPQTLRIPVTATSVRGATATVDLAILLEAPPVVPVEERTPVPAALKFLTPAAEALHLTGPLGEFAELGLLLFFLLLAIAATFLVLFLVRTPFVSVTLSPKRAVVAPGATAEFRVEVESRRRRKVANVRGILRTAGAPFRPSISMGGDRMGPDQAVEVAIPKDHPAAGTLRIHVPDDASDRDRQVVEFDVVPLAEDGTPLPSHHGHAKVEVRASPPPKATGYASARDIQLAEVRHSPPNPRPGAPVSTTATIHNDGAVPAQLRVVLQLDGHGVAEERVELPPRGTRQVTLSWTAGPGRNQVKVQVFLA